MQSKIKNIITQSDLCQNRKDQVGQVRQKKLKLFIFPYMFNKLRLSVKTDRMETATFEFD